MKRLVIVGFAVAVVCAAVLLSGTKHTEPKWGNQVPPSPKPTAYSGADLAKDVRTAIIRSLRNQGNAHPASYVGEVHCQDIPAPIKKGSISDCDVTDLDGGEAYFRVVFDDTQGHFTIMDGD